VCVDIWSLRGGLVILLDARWINGVFGADTIGLLIVGGVVVASDSGDSEPLIDVGNGFCGIGDLSCGVIEGDLIGFIVCVRGIAVVVIGVDNDISTGWW